MRERLVRLLAATLRLPLWLAIPVAFGVLAGLIALGNLSAFAGMWTAQSALIWFWLAVCAVYFSARIYRHYRGRETPMLEILGIIAAFHALALTAFFWGPLVHQTWRSYAAELMGFDLPIFAVIFVLIWGCASILVVARYEKLGRFDTTRTQLACAFGICGVLLLFAIDAQSAVPGFYPLYASLGKDMPGPTLWMHAVYPYWYAIPLLGAAMAGCVLFAPSREVRVRGRSFDGLIGLMVLTNLAAVVGFIALLLPQYTLCSQILADGTEPPRGETGFTRLHAAASLGRTNSVLRLIARGEPVDVRDRGGDTPLHYALMDDRADVARALIAKGANVNAANGNGVTPLHVAVAARSESSPELVKLLLERGAEINATADSGYTALHAAARSGRTDLAALLLAKGADVNALWGDATPLDSAYSYEQDQLVRLLLQHGAVRATQQERQAKKANVQARAVPSGRGCS